ncbi:CAP domain-containing protein [Paenibacillus wynnii]|uniref:CAP domain-containing protein n=1 Tax=Paenibacillus wynnii TaxID=268407 RepID=UPI00068D388D|nr:CAP domain-containing protein [Paenibacillus wynnii]
MKSKNLKALLIGGSLATVMAVSISLPSQASAATSSPIDLTNTRYEQILKYYQTYYSQTAPTVVVKTPVVTEQKAPVAPVAPTKTTPVTPPKSTPTTAVAAPKLTYTQQVVTLVNKERTAAGLKPVTGLDSLNKLAATKATDMRTNQYFSHTSPTYGSPFEMMGTFGITYRAAGENIAMGQKTPQEVMTAWMNSPGHRKNILSVDFNYIGVGFDNNYWVQEFIGK